MNDVLIEAMKYVHENSKTGEVCYLPEHLFAAVEYDVKKQRRQSKPQPPMKLVAVIHGLLDTQRIFEPDYQDAEYQRSISLWEKMGEHSQIVMWTPFGRIQIECEKRAEK
jgi:hypothetical protein